MEMETTASRLDRTILAVPAVVYVATVAILAGYILHETGHILYPIDDPYIHMAMARHWAEEGFFGVSQAGFSATSSSPGWTALLGLCFYVLGNHEAIPLLLNLLFGTLLLIQITWMLYKLIENALLASVCAGIAIYIVPLPAITCTGMEHPLHILLIVNLTSYVVNVLTDTNKAASPMYLFLIGMLAALARYETMFVVLPLTLLLWLGNRRRLAFVLVFSCVLPMAVLGVAYVSQDWFFFPTSIVQKSALQASGWEQCRQVFERLSNQLFDTGHLLVPFVLSLSFLLHSIKHGKALSSREGIWTVTFLAALLFHVSFASIGWFFRYEAYLLVLWILSVSSLLPSVTIYLREIWHSPHPPVERMLGRIVAIALFPLVIIPFSKNVDSIRQVVPGARNLFHQQYQMGLFLREYYDGQCVVANDIGAINYLSDINCLDLMGLGSMEPFRVSREGRWSPTFVDNWCKNRGAKIAVIYERWWNDVLPASWIKIGEWTVYEKVTVADTTVSFFALDKADVLPLVDNLKEFTSRLPEGIGVKIIEL